MQRLLYRTVFGSHVYGTSTPDSDQDYKAIYIPERNEFVHLSYSRTLKFQTKEDRWAKNQPGDQDEEVFSLDRFIELLLQGQMVAVDMLFIPRMFHSPTEHNAIWDEIYFNRSRFLHRGITSYVRYARHQAAQYGIKGSRVAAVRATLEFLAKLPPRDRLSQHLDALTQWVNEKKADDEEFISLVTKTQKNGQELLHLEVCDRMATITSQVRYVQAIYQKAFDTYGKRALAAEKNEGVDWKALMHAIRCSGEARELLTTGHITFPRPDAMELLRIRKGEFSYHEISERIVAELEELKDVAAQSILPEKPDMVFAQDLMDRVYFGLLD